MLLLLGRFNAVLLQVNRLMIIANYVVYDDFKTAVDKLGPIRRAIVLAPIPPGGGFSATALFNSEIALWLFLAEQPSSFMQDFPQAVFASRLANE